MSPAPAPLAAAPARVSSLGRRFLGWLVDGVVAALAATPLALAAVARGGGDGAPSALAACGLVLVVVVAVGQWVAHGLLGWTVGRLVLGMRTVDVDTLRPIGMLRVLLRGLVVAAGTLVLGIGQLVVLASPAFDRTGRNRGWHDRAARDEVVDLVGTDADAPVSWSGDAPGDVRLERHGSRGSAAEPSPWAPAPPPVQVPDWVSAHDASGAPAVTGSTPLVLAPLAPREHGPDVDTRVIPTVGTVRARASATTPAGGPAAVAVALPAAAVAGTATVLEVGALDARQVAIPELDPEVEMTRRVAPRQDVAPEPVVAVATPPDTAEVALSDGRRVVIDGVALVGRNPAAAVDVQLVRVVDPTRSVSKTHLQVAVTPHGVWVADRGSTNGTVVTLPDGAQVVCPVDQPVRLRAGASVAFGDSSFVLVRGPRARD
ncbi:RDD family protein [Cellulomonas sp. JH27-2]|uniref:RDD family protein n=1 Tax=Cellulomonas sp. JH27-2 TaxID=2774139 RepID=UPI00177F579C|nr:RDD family protein [Cellulomonas sp. JH27-2]MBD8058453.1 RDD family protein [Cellulomonas sp. JH27-2]